VPSRNIVTLGGNSAYVRTEVDRVFLKLGERICRSIRAGQGVVVLHQDSCAVAPDLHVLAAAVRPASRVKEEVSNHGNVRLIVRLDVRFAKSDYVPLNGEVAGPVRKNSIRNVAAPRKGPFRMDVVVKHVDGASTRYDDSVPGAWADF